MHVSADLLGYLKDIRMHTPGRSDCTLLPSLIVDKKAGSSKMSAADAVVD